MTGIHPNYTKASRLMLFLCIAGLIYFFLSNQYTTLSARNQILIPGLIIVFGGVTVYLLGKGYHWTKYVMLGFFIIGFIKPSTWTYLANLSMIDFVSVAFRTSINLWIIWLLFKVPNTIVLNEKGPDFSEPL
jgi:hypothetical protein